MKNIRLEDRLIFALDVPEVVDAKEIVSELDDSVNFYKIGMEMLMTGQYFELLDWLIKQEKKVFVDRMELVSDLIKMQQFFSTNKKNQ